MLVSVEGCAARAPLLHEGVHLPCGCRQVGLNTHARGGGAVLGSAWQEEGVGMDWFVGPGGGFSEG